MQQSSVDQCVQAINQLCSDFDGADLEARGCDMLL